MNSRRLFVRVLVVVALVLPSVSTLAELSSEDLAKLAQNPVGNLISVPFQNNVNFNSGTSDGTQNILNIQPVVPIGITKDWTIITRTILPVITQPMPTPGQGSVTGLGDMQLTAFVSPADPKNGIIWGAGMIVQAPTHTSNLGNDHWGIGPSAVLLHLKHSNPWVFGALVNNVFSVGNDADPTFSNFLLQPFLNYNFKSGLYLTTAPIITAAWKAADGQKWVVPVGGGVGKIFHFGKLPVNSQVSAYYNAARPDNFANWQLRIQVQFMFPK